MSDRDPTEVRTLNGEFFDEEEQATEQGSWFLTKEREDELFAYIDKELSSLILNNERKRYLERIARYRDRRIGIPAEEVKTFPWDGASNVVPPIALMETNGMFSMLKSSFKARKPFYMVTGSNDEYKTQAEGIGAGLDMLIEAPNYINLRKKNNKLLYDLGSLGTHFVKVRWNDDKRSWKTPNDDGTFTEVALSVKSYPDIELKTIEDIFTRVYWDDPQTCPLIADRIPYTLAELRALEHDGTYENIEDVIQRGGDEVDENKLELLDKLGLNPESTIDEATFYVFEISLSWDVDSDGVLEEIIAWYDPVSKARLRLEMNNIGHRPVYNINLLEIPGSLYGLGVGGLVDNIQEEIIDLHNMRNDSTLLSMLQIVFIKNGIPFGLKEGLRPGSVKRLPDPQKDVYITKLPDVSMSTIAGEQMLQKYSHNASAVTEDTLGFADSTVRTRETYSGMLHRSQSSSRVYAAMEESVKEGFSEIGIGLFMQLLAHKEEAMELSELLPEEKRQGFLDALETPIAEVTERFTFSIQTMELEKTEEAKRQAYLTLSQLYTMYAEKIFQLLQIVYTNTEAQIPPQIKEVAMEVIVGSTKLLSKIMKSFGEDDYEDYLPYVRNMELLIEALDLQKETQTKQLEAQIRQMKGDGENERI
jgi:hypothetical protein